MRPGFGSAAFLAVMLATSAINLLRVIVVAWLMPVDAFAAYATITAAAAFLGTILSFGAIEETIKAFPRLVADSGPSQLRREARKVLFVVARRAALFGVPLATAGWWLDSAPVLQIGIAFGFALAMAYTAIVASMQRAVPDPVRLASGTGLRSLSIFGAVILATRAQDLTVLLAVEAAAILLSCWISERLFFGRSATAPAIPPAPAPVQQKSDGIRIFLAFAMVSAPFYLDRLFVTTVLGGAEASRYAALAVLLTGASLLVNTIAQRVGPDAIRLVHQHDGPAALRQVVVWCGLFGLLWLAAIAGFGLVVALGWLPAGLERYDIALAELVPVALAGVLLMSSLLEFLLIALDRERAFQRAAACFLVSVLAAAAAVVALGLDLPGLLWLMVAARTVYVAVLIFSLPWSDLRRREEGDASA